MGFIKALIGLPLSFIVLVFAFVNNDMATFSLWPTGIEITVSLSVAIIFFIIVGYVIGWMFAWISYASVRKALRTEKKQNKKLSKEQEKLVKEVEGLQGDIDNLKTTPSPEKKITFMAKMKKFFARKQGSDKDF